ncbi:type II toxin-antitoxin system HicA family toxin [Candidatus Gottesmanbacteria bacterium]|nr:type II toxin-antitoxin system HicA family toxin [Candidatus Gottesmanbacteria bacterium]
MTKMPRNIKGKELLRVLDKLGFYKTGSRGSHVRLTHADGRWTQVAVHPKPIPQGTLRAILRQAEITIDQLIETL